MARLVRRQTVASEPIRNLGGFHIRHLDDLSFLTLKLARVVLGIAPGGLLGIAAGGLLGTEASVLPRGALSLSGAWGGRLARFLAASSVGGALGRLLKQGAVELDHDGTVRLAKGYQAVGR